MVNYAKDVEDPAAARRSRHASFLSFLAAASVGFAFAFCSRVAQWSGKGFFADKMVSMFSRDCEWGQVRIRGEQSRTEVFQRELR